MRALLTADDVDRLHALEHGGEIIRAVPSGPGVDDRGGREIVGRKKLLRKNARLSALPKVTPIDTAHGIGPFECTGQMPPDGHRDHRPARESDSRKTNCQAICRSRSLKVSSSST